MDAYLSIDWKDPLSAAKGWLVIWNFVKGYAGGGIRMHPGVTRDEVAGLAECMAYKYKACESVDCGGCKGGIAYDSAAPDARQVLERYIAAMMPYIEVGVSLGGDLGTSYATILEIFKSFGCDLPLTRTMRNDPQITRNMLAYDDLMAEKVDGVPINDMMAGFGVACATDEAWNLLCMSRLGQREPARVCIQGMGRVAFACARQLAKGPYLITGMADSRCFVHAPTGLDLELLYQLKKADRNLAGRLPDNWQVLPSEAWVASPCDILIPAALAGVVNQANAQLVQAKLLVEAANMPVTPEADAKLYANGVYLICDFTANLLEAWLYDAVLFGRVDANQAAVLAAGERLCRKNARLQMEAALIEGVYARQSAQEIFAPDTQSPPDL